MKNIGGLLVLLSAGCSAWSHHRTLEQTQICVGKDETGQMTWVDASEIKQYEKEHRVARETALEHFREKMHLSRTPNMGEEFKVEFDFDTHDYPWAKESYERSIEIKGGSSPEQPAPKSSSLDKEGPSSP